MPVERLLLPEIQDEYGVRIGCWLLTGSWTSP